MSLFLITSDNQTINMDLVTNFVIAGTPPNNINFLPVPGGSPIITSTMQNPAQAVIVFNQILSILQSGVQGVVQLSPCGVVISACNPMTFVALGGAGPTLLLTGVFSPDIGKGVLHVEDWPGGGMDSNGLTYSLQYVSPTQAIATWATNGDSTVGASAIYYTDPDGNSSNVLTGITTS